MFFAGDVGLIWDRNESGRERYELDWLNSCNFTSMLLFGNHENWDRIRKLPLINKFGVNLYSIRENVFGIPNGTLMEHNGKKFFFMGGALSTDKNRRQEGVSWWPGEIATREEMQFGVDNLDKNNWKVDYVITHTMPKECVKEFVFRHGYHHTREIDPMSSYLSFLVKQGLKYDKWFCGHFHKDSRYLDVRVVYKDILEFGLDDKKVLDICPGIDYNDE